MWAENFEDTKFPPLQSPEAFLESFLGPLLLDTLFSSVISFYIFVHSFDTSCASLGNSRYSESGDLPVPFASFPPLVIPFLRESEHVKLITFLIINLLLADFYGQTILCEGVDRY